MENRSLLQSGTSAEPRKNLAKSADVLSRFFKKWTVIFPNHPTGAQAVAIYLDALSDLTADQIEAGCIEAGKTAEQFPKPGHIRNAVPATTHGSFLGLPQLTYPEVSQEERDAALEYSAALRKVLGKARPAPVVVPTKKKTFAPAQPPVGIEDQKEILRRKGYL